MTRKTCMAAFSKEHLRVITPVAEDHRANKFQRNTDFAYPVQMSRTKHRRKGIILNHKNTAGNTNPVQIGLRRHYKETGLIYLKVVSVLEFQTQYRFPGKSLITFSILWRETDKLRSIFLLQEIRTILDCTYPPCLFSVFLVTWHHIFVAGQLELLRQAARVSV